jgi:PiT family inorganic phosphate transporter
MTPDSTLAIAVLVVCLALVLAFEFTNGFHDSANAVATVIYTRSLKPAPAVILSGALNFAGVLLGGVAVAYTLVELLPPDVLTPPNGAPATAMLLALFLSALIWNVATWWMGIPCSSSHCIVGALVGVALASSVTARRGLGAGVDWSELWSVLEALLFSPVLGFIGAGLLFRLSRLLIRDKALYEPVEEDRKPAWHVRALLILTCSGVSFAHGSNDGQKSIGLIMLVIIGLSPAAHALNLDLAPDRMASVAQAAERAAPIIKDRGDDERDQAEAATGRLAEAFRRAHAIAELPEQDRASIRQDVLLVETELKHAGEQDVPKDERAEIGELRGQLRAAVEYAPWWVRALSAVCLGLGTMIGYRRIVTTIGERLGDKPMVPAQGAAAELVAAGLIGAAGVSGLPVSTTHIVTSGVAGTMAGSGAGLQPRMLWQIAIAWVLTLPVTMLLSGGIFWLLAHPAAPG